MSNDQTAGLAENRGTQRRAHESITACLHAGATSQEVQRSTDEERDEEVSQYINIPSTAAAAEL